MNSTSRRPIQPSSLIGDINKRAKKPGSDIAVNQSTVAGNKFNQLKKELPDYEVYNLGFGLMSNEERQALAVVTISDSKKTKDPQAVNSSDMGSTSRTDICPTCKLRYPDCNGHYGLITLPTPIFNPLFKKMMISIMSVVCHHCGDIKVPNESIESHGILRLPPKQRLNALVDINGDKDSSACPHCFKSSTAVKKGDLTPNKILRDGDSPLTIQQIESLLDKKRFTTDRAAILGFTEGAHPGNIIMRNLLVIPEQLRRDFQIDGNTKHSDLTNAYSSIVNECNSYTTLRKNGSSVEVLQAKIERISTAISDLYVQPEATNGKELKSISSNFKGKESVTRPGRRTNDNSRAVLGPGPQLGFGQIAIPIEHSKVLLRKEKVTRYNLSRARTLIAKGQVTYIIKDKETNKILITDDTRMDYSRSIKISDTIFRHTMDGDQVIMNRQPTIDKGSLQSYNIVIWNKRTIGIFLPSTSAHNIDFDGDEGNVYGSVSVESIAEFMEIIHSTSNIISSQSGKPSVGLVMNALSAGYALTSKDIIISKVDIQGAYNDVSPPFTFKSFCDRALVRGGNMYYSNTEMYSSIVLQPGTGNGKNMLEGQEMYLTRGEVVNISPSESYTIGENGMYKVVDGEVLINRSLIKVTEDNWSGIPDYYDGKLYFSVALPTNFQYRRGDILIQDGIMLSGQLTKEHIGGSSGSIIHVIYSDFGKDVCSKFVGDATHILDEYARKRGISVGVYDYCPGIGSDKKRDDLEHARHKVMVELRNKILDLPDVTNCNIEMKKRVENKVVEYMERATNEIGIKILNEYTDPDSGLTIMANSGAKGSSDNVAHTTGIIGPQYERGHRIQYAISGGTRTTPYFVPNDVDVESRGFVFRNYGEGVTPADAAHMSVPTRTSIVNTAVEVSTSGYLARKLARFLEDVVASYLGSVTVNAVPPGGKIETVNRIATLVYGDDGFDVSKLENVKTPIGNTFLPVNIERVVSKINAEYGIFTNVMKDSEYLGPIEYEE